MSKKTIAVDVDDVLAAEAEFVIEYGNKHWGHSLSLDDYHEDWAQMWQVSDEEAERRALEIHAPGLVSTYRLLDMAHEALQELAKHYRLVILTSRRSIVKDETMEWLDKNFGDIFSEVRLTGFYDDTRTGRIHLTKAEMLQEMGADYLIDDQPKHCIGAAEAGIKAVLFGDYGIGRHLELPKHVTRCKDWPKVLEYFNDQQ